MDPKTAQILLGAAGSGGAGEPVFPEELFSVDIYDGNDGSNRAINNGIDLSGEGGCVWLKHRGGSFNGIMVQDTERFVSSSNSNQLDTASTGVEGDFAGFTSFNSNGFSVSDAAGDLYNASGEEYVAWTFRKASKFFDIVKYTGTGSVQTISHNLGSVPGMIIVKGIDIGTNWTVYHRGTGSTKYLRLNTDTNAATSSAVWNDTDPTSSVFTVGTSSAVNSDGYEYIAYIFAHNESEFGENQDEAIIHCGSYSGTGNKNGNKITTGFEPQFILFKKHDGQYNADWMIFDTARGMEETFSAKLFTGSTNAESVSNDSGIRLLNDGFDFRTSTFEANGSFNYVYMAIGRPTKEPSAGSEVFQPLTRTGTGDNNSNTFTDVVSTIKPDLCFVAQRSDDSKSLFITKKIGPEELETSTNAAEATYIDSDNSAFDVPFNKGIRVRGDDVNTNRGAPALGNYHYIFHFFKRARKFFDVVLYDGNQTSNRNISHGLGVAPELIIIKARSTTNDWVAWHKDIGNGSNGAKEVRFNTTSGAADGGNFQTNGGATATHFGVGSSGLANGSGVKQVAYLFASLPGISKIGSYTGTGSNVNVDCGFTAGARFVMVKRIDGGHWYGFDTARGIVTGNDPWLYFNQDFVNSADNSEGGWQANNEADYIDPLNAGFTITSAAPSGLNQNGDTYMFFAIA